MHGPPHHIVHKLSLTVVVQLGVMCRAFARDVVPARLVVEVDGAKKMARFARSQLHASYRRHRVDKSLVPPPC